MGLSEIVTTLFKIAKGCNFLLKISEKRGSTRLYINASLVSSGLSLVANL